MSAQPASLPFPFPLPADDITAKRRAILQALIKADPAFGQIPVRRMRTDTPQRMLTLYDEAFFSGFMQKSYGELPVTLSRRMTQAAGKFTYTKLRGRKSAAASGFQIRMSTDFLARLEQGPFHLNGLAVATPQEAFLVVFEHELCHAAEFKLFGKTAHGKNFKALARGLFGHTDIHHQLPTRQQEAAEAGLRIGSRVSFLYEGKTLSGMISYVGKMATVMVPDLRGMYRDERGRRYAKYRVPLSALHPVRL